MSQVTVPLKYNRLIVVYMAGGILGLAVGLSVWLVSPTDAVGITGLLLGFMGIAVVGIQSRSKTLFRILLAAYLIRVILALIQAFVLPLPDSQADALTYQGTGWALAQSWHAGAPFGFSPDPRLTGPSLYSKLIGVVYYLLGQAPLFIQAINVVLGTLLVYNVYRITGLLFGQSAAKIGGWMTALYPTLVFYSVITLRGELIVYPLSLFVWWLLLWIKRQRSGYLFKASLALFATVLFHSVFLFLYLVPLARLVWQQLASFAHARLGRSVKLIALSAVVLAVLAAVFTTNIWRNKLPAQLSRLSGIGRLPQYVSDYRTHTAVGRTAYLAGLQLHSFPDLIRATPTMVAYFLYAPFPWMASNIQDVFGVVDGTLIFILTILSLAGLKDLYRQKQWGALWVVVLVFILGVCR